MPIKMEGLPELPEIKSEIKAEDFCNSSVNATTNNTVSNNTVSNTTITNTQEQHTPATSTVTTLVDLQTQQQQQQNNCNWVGYICILSFEIGEDFGAFFIWYNCQCYCW